MSEKKKRGTTKATDGNQATHKAVLKAYTFAYSIGFKGIDSLDELDGMDYLDFRDELEESCGFCDWFGCDVDDIESARLYVDGEEKTISVSANQKIEAGKQNSWDTFRGERGIYFNDVDKRGITATCSFTGDFDPSKLRFRYQTVVWGPGTLNLLSEVTYDGIPLELDVDDDADGKGFYSWLVDGNRYAEYDFGQDVSALKWLPIPGEETPRKGSKGKKSATKGGKAKKVISEIISNMVAIPGKNYKMGKYEVTQAQWAAVMGNNPSKFKNSNNPVENISWDDCQKFIRKLNALPEVKASGLTFRLPTDEEWEYACRAGSTGDYCKLADGTEITEETLGDVAWYDVNSEDKTHPVGQKQPNALGLYDMYGNVWEWCEDLFEAGRSRRVDRGGSWCHLSSYCTAGNRSYNDPDDRCDYLGFRLAASQDVNR